MPSLPLKPVSPKISGNRIVYAGLSLLFIAVILLAFYAGRSVVTADQWHFLDVIRDYYQHGFSFRDVWEGQGPHRTPGYKTLFLLDAIYFRLNLKLEIYAGILALLAMAVMIYLRYRESMRDSLSSVRLQLSFLVIATVIFSFNQWALYFYSLSSLDNFLGKMFFVLVWCYMDRGIRRSLSYDFISKFCLAFLLLLLIFGEGMGAALILVALIVMLLSGFSSHSWSDRKYRVLLIATISTSIVSQLIYWAVPPKLQGTGHLFDAMLVVFTQPLGTVEYVLTTLGSSLLNASWLKVSSHADAALYAVGTLVLLAYLAAAWLFFRNRMWQKTWLPLILMLYSVLFLGLLLVGRYGTGDLNSEAAPRYATDLQLGLVGILWVFYYARYSSQAVAGKWIKSLAVVSTAFVLVMQAGSVFLVTGMAPYQKTGILKFTQYLINSQPSDYFSNPPPRFYCPDPALCVEGVELLKEYGLRPFHPVSISIENNGANAAHTNIGGAITAIAGNLKIWKYGPSTIRANIGFHVQANGESALWIMMSQELEGKVYVFINGIRLPGVHRGNLVTAEVPASLYSKPGSYPMYVLEVRGNQAIKSNQVDFVVH
ncbi:MAG TPA: hypothetical protein VNF46_01585 [Gammaproteobacteria bacterium]|nr:hypothetical protein [Gammaproteobacteria bacterium]